MMLANLINRITNWQKTHLGSRTLLVMASILVGIISALAAIILKTFVHFMHRIPEYFSGYPAIMYGISCCRSWEYF